MFFFVALMSISVSAFKIEQDNLWYEKYIRFTAVHEIIGDINAPADATINVTRAEFVAAMYNIADPNDGNAGNPFSDVSPDSKYYKAISWAYQNKVTVGTSEGEFMPDAPLNREMAMTFLYRLLTPLEIDAPRNGANLYSSFSDSEDISEWAIAAINSLLSLKIITGTENNELLPKKELNFAEIATLIYNIMAIKYANDGEEWKLNTTIIDLGARKIYGTGASYTNNEILITEGGEYALCNKYTGTVRVSTEERVKIRLHRADITSESGPCIYVESADKVFLTLENGTENRFYALQSEDGAIYSKDDLEIKGRGKLFVDSAAGHGIKASDDLQIEEGEIVISAAKDGIHINGTCELKKGSLSITSLGDGIDSENEIIISKGEYSILTAGNIEESSSKGLSASTYLEINGGNFVFNTTDKAIKCDGNIEINGGNIEIFSENKGISAIGNVTITNGSINIVNATEGIESKQILTISGGDISISASDDGLNTGADIIYSEVPQKIPASQRKNTLVITGGNIEITAKDDCLDSNAAMYISGGTVKVSRGKGELIDAGAAAITIKDSATLIYASEKLYATENPNNEQNTIALILKTQDAGTRFLLTDSNNNIIAEYVPKNKFEAITVSSPKIKTGETYIVQIGNRSYKIKATYKFTSVNLLERK